MNINIEFLVVAHFISLFVDWIFQWNWQAVNKSKWGKNDNKYDSFLALFLHSFTYAFATWWIVDWIYLLVFRSIIIHDKFILIFMILFITHFIIDSRIPVKWIMKFKGMSKEQVNDYQNFGFMHIGIDHRLHELVLLILSFFI